MLLLDTKKTTFHVRIKVFGIGGGGSNVVDTMIRAKLDRIFFSAVNTDLQFLMESKADSISFANTGLWRFSPFCIVKVATSPV